MASQEGRRTSTRDWRVTLEGRTGGAPSVERSVHRSRPSVGHSNAPAAGETSRTATDVKLSLSHAGMMGMRDELQHARLVHPRHTQPRLSPAGGRPRRSPPTHCQQEAACLHRFIPTNHGDKADGKNSSSGPKNEGSHFSNSSEKSTEADVCRGVPLREPGRGTCQCPFIPASVLVLPPPPVTPAPARGCPPAPRPRQEAADTHESARCPRAGLTRDLSPGVRTVGERP